MSDLISRQAVIDAFTDEIQVTGRANAESVKAYVKLVVDRIKRLPSAQPEIIYCKDCKHRPDKAWFGCPMASSSKWQLDGFCSYAERREE